MVQSSVYRFRPLAFQKPFLRSKANIQVLVAPNQTGKTICMAVKSTALLLGVEQMKRWENQNLIVYFVSAKLEKISEIWGRKLLMDDPWDEWSLEEACKDCPRADVELNVCRYQDCLKGMNLWDRKRYKVPPLIPVSVIKDGWDGVAWYDKKTMCPKTIPLVTGHVLQFRSGEQEPLTTWQGIQFHRFNGDDELGTNARIMYGELIARVMRFQGQLLFDATPVGNYFHIRELKRRAAVTWVNEEKSQGPGNDGQIESFVFRPPGGLEFFSQAARNAASAQYARLDEPERKAREFGEPIEEGHMAFPKWDPDFSIMDVDPDLSDATFYELLDPGWDDPCAVLYVAALPPRKDNQGKLLDDPEHPRLHVWDMQYDRKISLDALVEKMRGVRGKNLPIAIYVDARADQRRQETVETFLEGMQERLTQDNLGIERGAWHDVADGVRAIAGLMEKKKLTVNAKCEMLVREIEMYHRKWRRNEDGERKERFAGPDHAVSALRAGVMRGLPWLNREQRWGKIWHAKQKTLREFLNAMPSLLVARGQEEPARIGDDRWGMDRETIM